MRRFLYEKTRWNNGAGKKRKSLVGTAAAFAVVWVFGVCVTNAWAVPSSGESVSSNIVVRDSAVTGAQIGSLVEGQEVTITGETTGSDGKNWYSITFEIDGSERDGWVRADLIDTTAAADNDADSDANGDTEQTGTEDTAAADGQTEDAAAIDGETQDASATGTLTVRVELANGYVDLTDVPEDAAAGVSDRYVESECALAAGTVTGYQVATADALVSNDAILTNYYYLYGTNDIGESGWYVYDASQGSLQKSIVDMSYSLTDTEADAETTQSELSDTVRMIVAALALVCLLLLILVIVFSVRYRRLRGAMEELDDFAGEASGRKDAEKQAVSKTMEIMDLDDMDDADYEAMLGRYLDDHMEPEEDAPTDSVEPRQQPIPDSTADLEEMEKKPAQESVPEENLEEDDDLEFL